jgi:hypothetical protein
LKIETESDEDESEGSDSESSDTLDLSKITEMRLVPSDPSQCIIPSSSFYVLQFNAKITAIMPLYIL